MWGIAELLLSCPRRLFGHSVFFLQRERKRKDMRWKRTGEDEAGAERGSEWVSMAEWSGVRGERQGEGDGETGCSRVCLCCIKLYLSFNLLGAATLHCALHLFLCPWVLKLTSNWEQNERPPRKIYVDGGQIADRSGYNFAQSRGK